MKKIELMTTEQLKNEIKKMTDLSNDKLHLQLVLRLIKTLEKND